MKIFNARLRSGLIDLNSFILIFIEKIRPLNHLRSFVVYISIFHTKYNLLHAPYAAYCGETTTTTTTRPYKPPIANSYRQITLTAAFMRLLYYNITYKILARAVPMLQNLHSIKTRSLRGRPLVYRLLSRAQI